MDSASTSKHDCNSTKNYPKVGDDVTELEPSIPDTTSTLPVSISDYTKSSVHSSVQTDKLHDHKDVLNTKFDNVIVPGDDDISILQNNAGGSIVDEKVKHSSKEEKDKEKDDDDDFLKYESTPIIETYRLIDHVSKYIVPVENETNKKCTSLIDPFVGVVRFFPIQNGMTLDCYKFKRSNEKDCVDIQDFMKYHDQLRSEYPEGKDFLNADFFMKVFESKMSLSKYLGGGAAADAKECCDYDDDVQTYKLLASKQIYSRYNSYGKKKEYVMLGIFYNLNCAESIEECKKVWDIGFDISKHVRSFSDAEKLYKHYMTQELLRVDRIKRANGSEEGLLRYFREMMMDKSRDDDYSFFDLRMIAQTNMPIFNRSFNIDEFVKEKIYQCDSLCLKYSKIKICEEYDRKNNHDVSFMKDLYNCKDMDDIKKFTHDHMKDGIKKFDDMFGNIMKVFNPFNFDSETYFDNPEIKEMYEKHSQTYKAYQSRDKEVDFNNSEKNGTFYKFKNARYFQEKERQIKKMKLNNGETLVVSDEGDDDCCYCSSKRKKSSSFSYPLFISVEGNIGAGKSHFLNELKTYLKNCNFDMNRVIIIPEPIPEWKTLLENFYKNPKMNGTILQFKVLDFFNKMMIRIHQLRNEYDLVVLERSHETSYHVFTKLNNRLGNIEDYCFDVFEATYKEAEKDIYPELDMIVALTVKDSEFNELKDRILKRKSADAKVDLDYLRNLEKTYTEYYKNNAEKVVELPVFRYDKHDQLKVEVFGKIAKVVREKIAAKSFS